MDQIDMMMQLPELEFAPSPSTFSFNYAPNPAFSHNLHNHSTMESMREMIYGMAVMQPVHIEPEMVKPPKRRNVRISKDPQSVAARQRRERISERMRILQRMVPGGTKMDTASMLDEAIHYVKFLKKQVQKLEKAGVSRPLETGFGFEYGSGFCPTNGGLYMNA